ALAANSTTRLPSVWRLRTGRDFTYFTYFTYPDDYPVLIVALAQLLVHFDLYAADLIQDMNEPRQCPSNPNSIDGDIGANSHAELLRITLPVVLIGHQLLDADAKRYSVGYLTVSDGLVVLVSVNIFAWRKSHSSTSCLCPHHCIDKPWTPTTKQRICSLIDIAPNPRQRLHCSDQAVEQRTEYSWLGSVEATPEHSVA